MKSFRDTIYFMDLSGAEPVQSVCKGETEGVEKNMRRLLLFVTLQRE